jgi:hypothetical protein
LYPKHPGKVRKLIGDLEELRVDISQLPEGKETVSQIKGTVAKFRGIFRTLQDGLTEKGKNPRAKIDFESCLKEEEKHRTIFENTKQALWKSMAKNACYRPKKEKDEETEKEKKKKKK